MDNTWVQIIGTLLVGGALMNWIIPLYVSMFGMRAKPDEVNEICVILGGKIHRKWFFFNTLIFIAVLTLLLLLISIFLNWVMFIILLPYFLALYLLYWTNIYKRLNAISDNHALSIFITCIMAIFCLVSNKLYEIFPNIITNTTILFFIIMFFIFVLPTKNIQKDIEKEL